MTSDTQRLLENLNAKPEAIVKVLAWLEWSPSRLIDAMDNDPRIALSYDGSACSCHRYVIGNKKYTHIRRRDADR